MDNTANLKISYADIQERLRLLFDVIDDKATDIRAYVFQLPSPSNDDIGDKPTLIPVTPFTEDTAYQLAKAHSFLHTLNQERSGRVLPRLPGIVMIEHPDPLDCLSRMADINRAKDDFKKQVKNISTDKNVRFREVSKAFPDLVKLQTFRHLLFLNASAQTVGFSWVNRNSVKCYKKLDVIDLLQKADGYYKDRQPLSDFLELVQKEQVRIGEYPPDAEFVIRRPQRITPMMNVRYYSPKNAILPNQNMPANIVAHSPLFVFNHSPKVHDLNTYVRPENEVVLDDIAPVIPRLHLYEKSKLKSKSK